MKLLSEGERGRTLRPPALRVRCLTTENVFHMNSEKRPTSHSCYSVSLSSVSFDLYRLYSVVYFYFCVFSVLSSQSPRRSLRTFNLTLKFDISARGPENLKCSKHRHRAVRHLDYYCCVLNSKSSSQLAVFWSRGSTVVCSHTLLPGLHTRTHII